MTINKFSAEWLAHRSAIVAALVRAGVLETKDDIAGFWRGEDWVSVYDLLEQEID